MMFIEEFDDLASDDAAGRNGLFFRSLSADWRGLFAELRQRRPILHVPAFVAASLAGDGQVLILPEIHLLQDGQSQIDNGGGPFAERFVVGIKRRAAEND